MILCFELSMPSKASWNRKWSGEDQYYAKTVNLGDTKKAIKKGQEIIDNGPYRYNWSDEWAASISVRQVDGKESKKIQRKSDGFCGYDWMTQSIQDCGKILASWEIGS